MERLSAHLARLMAAFMVMLVAFSHGTSVRPRCLARSGMGAGMAFARRHALSAGARPRWN